MISLNRLSKECLGGLKSKFIHPSHRLRHSQILDNLLVEVIEEACVGLGGYRRLEC